MNCNKMPEMGSAIYLNGCSCNCLWNEMQADDRAERKAAVETVEEIRMTERDTCDENCMPEDNFAAWPVGMAYVPMQPWEEPYDLAKGLRAGTIFPSLRLPFRGGGR